MFSKPALVLTAGFSILIPPTFSYIFPIAVFLFPYLVEGCFFLLYPKISSIISVPEKGYRKMRLKTNLTGVFTK